jgi:translocation and assembly module TamA
MKARLALQLFTAIAFAFSWTLAAIAQEAAPQWRVELDAPQDVRPLLEEHLDLYRFRDRPGIDAEMLQRLISRVDADARALLATAGYFQPHVAVTAEHRVTGIGTVISIKVATGPAARVTRSNIRIIGAIADSPADADRIARIERRWRLPAGSPFRQANWDEAKDALLREFVFDGYPAARIAASTAEVDPETAAVSINLTVDSGPLFHFGATEIDGLQRYPRRLVENLQRFRSGERYSYDAVLAYQAELQASGFFKSASVSVDADPAQAAAALVRVQVVEYPEKKIELGAGYSTDTGPRGEASFTHYNALQPGWQGTTRLRLASREQIFNGELALTPEPGGWRNRFGAETARSDIENLVTRRFGLTAQRTWRSPQQDHDWALKLQGEEQAVTGGPVDNLQALSLNYSWTRRRVDDAVRPRRGYLLNLQLGGASASLLSTRSFLRSYGRGLYIVPLGRSDRLHLRSELGAVWADSSEGIPSEFLFRTGGDQSVRGYDYQSLGVARGTAIVGGRFLAVGTVEYQHDFTPQWGGALFVDAGDAADTPSALRPVYGYGAGVRWITPAGALNFDIARARETGKVRLHFTLGARF